MGNYSEEDKKAFKLKDQLNSRMSAIKAASLNNEGKGISAEGMLAEADKYYSWLYPNGSTADDTKPANTTLPTPTAAQKAVLDAIMDKGIVCDYDVFRKQVLDWAEKTHGIRKYPENINSVDDFIKWDSKGE